jgi:hypothetical protein
LLVLLALLLTIPAVADESTIKIAIVTQERDPVLPVSLSNREIRDEGLAGARRRMADHATTGRFTKQPFALVVHFISKDRNPADTIRALCTAWSTHGQCLRRGVQPTPAGGAAERLLVPIHS